MASILDRYGIKEVADVTFYEINDDGTPGKPVLYLDTLKVSTIEQTAETADARGGKGNPKLITWDYGKEITVNIEDALFSPKSMAIMLGDGVVTKATSDNVTRNNVVRATASTLPSYFTADVYDSTVGGAVRKKVFMFAGDTPAGMIAYSSAGINLTHVYNEDGAEVKDNTNAAITTTTAWRNATNVTPGNKYFVQYTAPATTKTITISGDSFPGTYYVQGDTYARSDVDGKDQFFQFIIPKAKMTAENTITLEAEGDPSTFNMNLTVLRPESGDMMKLVQYDLTAG